MLRVVVTVALVAFTVYAVVDCIQTENDRVRNLPKIAWAALILLFTPAGGIAWFVAGRPRSSGGPSLPWGGPGTRPPAPRGPDDDPDFLRNL